MSYSDLHTHTIFSDGKNTAEEMVLAAIARGMETIGISDHSPTFFDKSYCMKKEKLADYKETIFALKEKYKDQIKVLCGIEQDSYSAETPEGFDYVIGSVHYIRFADDYIPVDEGADVLIRAAEKYTGGDRIALVEMYFETVSKVAEKWKPDILGHFDLIRKYNSGNAIYDEEDPRVIKAAEKALDTLLPYHLPFEINTGGIFRGCREDAYPAARYIDYIKAHGGKLILSSDAHRTDALCFQFPRYENVVIL